MQFNRNNDSDTGVPPGLPLGKQKDIQKHRGQRRISMFPRRELTPESKVSRQTGNRDGSKKVEWRGGKVDGTTSSMTT